jgi:hypothetical protein
MKDNGSPGGYEGSRFNAVRHGVLSELTVLPWEDEAEYAKLLEALVEEYAPRGPTEDHLIEEVAGVIWRKRRLRLAEAASLRRGIEKATEFSSNTLETALIQVKPQGPAGPILGAITATPAVTAKDLAKLKSREVSIRRALQILNSGNADAYEAALAELDEQTQAHWRHQVAPDLEDTDEYEHEDEEQYTANANGLAEYLEYSVLPGCVEQLGYVENRSLIRAQIVGEALDFKTLEPLGRYEVHLDRKLERAISMLLRLRELRQLNEASRSV